MNIVSVVNLIDTVQRASIAVSPRQQVPILTCVLMEFSGDKLKISGTNIETAIITSCNCTVENEFSIAVNAHKLLNIAKSLPKDKFVDFKLNKLSLSLSCSGSKFNMPIISADEFPPVPRIPCNDFDFEGSTTVKELINTLRSVSHAQSSDATRYIFNATFLDFGDNLKAVATDGRRLAFCQLDHKFPESTCVLPEKTVGMLMSYTDQLEVIIKKSKRMIMFEFDSDDILWSKLVEGTYPKWQDVYKPSDVDPISLNADQLKRQVSRAAIMTSDRNLSVTITASNNKLTLNSEDVSFGAVVTSMDCKYQGPEVSVSINPVYLIDILSQCKDEITLLIKDNIEPVYINSGNLNSMIMPLRN